MTKYIADLQDTSAVDRFIQRAALLMGSTIHDLANDTLSDAAQKDLLASYHLFEDQVAMLMERYPSGETRPHSVVRSGSPRLIQILPEDMSRIKAPVNGDIDGALKIFGSDYLESLEGKVRFESDHIGALILAAESDRSLLPALNRIMLSHDAKQEMLDLWFVQRNSTGCGVLMEGAPTIAPRVLRRQIDAWPDEAVRMKNNKRSILPVIHALYAVGLISADEHLYLRASHDLRPPLSSHERLAALPDITEFTRIANTPWECEGTSA